MTTYLVQPDDYAGWNPTGRNFALAAAAAGIVGLLAWLAAHGRLGALRPTAASDQLFLTALVWLGLGAFALMAVAVLGSLSLSLRSRGSVTITDQGVLRTVGARTQSLAWPEIEGFVPMSYGGVTLIVVPGHTGFHIPRFLDDYRACIAELKSHGIAALPPSRLRRQHNTSWKSSLQVAFVIFGASFATDPLESHHVRLAAYTTILAFTIWILKDDWAKPDPTTPRWIGIVIFSGIALAILWRMLLHW